MTAESDLHEEPLLLLLLDGLVRRAGRSAAPRQEICIGVERADGWRWWRVQGGARYRCGFVDACSSTAHATLCLSEADAERLVRTGHIAGDAHLLGDAAIMKRFVERYTRRMSLFGARVQSVEGHRRIGGSRGGRAR